MRILEIIIIITLFGSLCIHLWPIAKRPNWNRFLPGVTVLLILVHFAIESYRWQMVPAYFLASLLFLMSLRLFWRIKTNPDSKPSRIIGIIGAVGGLFWLCVATAIPLLMPVFKLPTPSGPYAIGSTFFQFVDVNREEIFTADPADKRKIMVRVWYPADSLTDADTMPFWQDAHTFGSLLAGSLNLPSFMFDHLSIVQSHAFRDVPVATGESSYPVLIFSHGYMVGFAAQNTVQMEELASRGYIVFSIDHPYESLAVVYPDGNTVPYSPERLAAHRREQTLRVPLVEKIKVKKDKSIRNKLLEQFIVNAPTLLESINVWVEDTLFVLDRLERINIDDRRFSEKLDLSRLGIFGMSHGGDTAILACSRDKRCRAGISMDGWEFGYLLKDQTITKPFMMMQSEPNENMNDFLYEHLKGPAYNITVKGSFHFNFSDFSLISPVFQYVGFLGPISGRRMMQITNSYVSAFFDNYLKGISTPIISGPSSDYPEITIDLKNL